MMGDTLTVVFTWAKVNGRKTESQVTETKGSRVTTMCPERIRKTRESSTVPVCVKPVDKRRGKGKRGESSHVHQRFTGSKPQDFTHWQVWELVGNNTSPIPLIIRVTWSMSRATALKITVSIHTHFKMCVQIHICTHTNTCTKRYRYTYTYRHRYRYRYRKRSDTEKDLEKDIHEHHNAFMFFASCICFKHFCRFQVVTAQPDREETNVKNKNWATTTHVQCVVCKQGGNGRQPDNTCELMLIDPSEAKGL